MGNRNVRALGEQLVNSPRLTMSLAIAILFALSTLPLVLLGERSWITVHDNLDSNVAWIIAAVRQGPRFVLGFDDTLPTIMNGLPRSGVSGMINIRIIPFFLLPPFWAFALNALMVRLVAFGGCSALLRRFAPESSSFRVAALGAGLVFALLPFYTVFGVTTAGLPLLLHAWLALEEGDARWYHWLTVALFPLYSALFLIGVFVVPMMALRAGWLLLKRQAVARTALAATGVFIVSSVLSEWPSIWAALAGSGEVMQRAEVDVNALQAQVSIPSIGATFAQFVLDGQGHAVILHPWPIALALLLAIPSLRHSPRGKLVAGLVLSILGLVILASVYPVVSAKMSTVVPILERFPFSRGYFFLSLLWFLLFGACLQTLASNRHGAVLVTLLLLLQGGSIVLSNAEIVGNFAILARGNGRTPTFGEFYEPELFSAIQAKLGPPAGYRVAAIGMFPSILQYNGFYTLDSYQSLYPLAYKREFRKIIAGELDKSADLRVYFDAWGSRCYVFAAELGKYYEWDKNSGKFIHDLALDLAQFRAMGGRYLISSVPITRVAGNSPQLVGVFESPKSFWRLHVYDAITPLSEAETPRAQNPRDIARASAQAPTRRLPQSR